MSDIQTINEDEIDLLDLVSILVKNIKLIVGISLAFMVFILVYAIISLKLPPEKSYMPNVYSPKSIIMLNENSSSGGLDSLLGSSGLGSLASLAGISSGGGGGLSNSALAVKLASTNSFRDKLDEEFGLSEIYKTIDSDYPKTTLRNLIDKKLLIEEKDGMLEISYTDVNRELATDIVNRVTDLLEEEFAEIDRVRNRTQYQVAEEKMALVQREMDRLQDEIIKFQIKHNILDVEILATEIVKLMSELQSNLLQKEVEIDSYGKIANIRDPGYVKLINERDAILNAISKLENGEVGDYPAMKDLPRLALELLSLERHHEVQLVGYKALVQQSETLKLTAEGTGPTFQILEKAEIPEVKSGPSRGKLVIIVSFAGFFFSIFFVFIKEAFMNIKSDPEKMRRLKGIK